jgi:hypothetical protein
MTKMYIVLCLLTIFVLSYTSTNASSTSAYTYSFSNLRKKVDISQSETSSSITIDMSSIDDGKLSMPSDPVFDSTGKKIALLTAKYTGGGNANIGVMIYDVDNEVSTNTQNIFHNVYVQSEDSVKWLTQNKLAIYGGGDCMYLYNMDTGTTDTIWADSTYIWSTDGNNRVSVFNRSGWGGPFIKIKDYAHLFVNKELRASEELRYNGYWVYPERIRGWDTYEEYRQWLGDMTRYEYSRAPMQDPIIRDSGVALTENHIFARPCFVGDTAWVATFEQVFPLSNYTQVLSSKFVLLDAHDVHENPPLSSHVQVKTVETIQNSYVPREFAEFVDLLCTLKTQWNSETSKLELIKEESEAGIKTRSEQKIAEVPIDLSTMTFGTPVFLVTRDNLKWSTYVTGE